jgi:hypothetical protein
MKPLWASILHFNILDPLFASVHKRRKLNISIKLLLNLRKIQMLNTAIQHLELLIAFLVSEAGHSGVL